MHRYGIASDYYNHGSYIVAMTKPDRGSHPNPMERIIESYHLLAEDGFEVGLIEKNAMQALLRSPAVAGALWNKFDGEIHPVKYVRGVADAARTCGALIYEGTPILEMTRARNGLLLRTPAGQVRAERVLPGMNVYTPQLDESYEQRIIPNRGQVFTTEPVAERLFNGVFYANDGWDTGGSCTTGLGTADASCLAVHATII